MNKEDIQVKKLVKHQLSSELQLYYEKIIDTIKGESYKDKTILFQTLSTDSGINQLVPYFTQFISYNVLQNLTNLPMLDSLMKLTHSLLLNPNIQVELYVKFIYNHHLVTTINSINLNMLNWKKIM
jgi:transcription initiation factor TFIID subunit 6